MDTIQNEITSSYLQEHKAHIIEEVTENGDYLRRQSLLFRALNKNLDPLFEERISLVHSDSMRQYLRQFRRLPNYFRKSVRKLSGIYDFEIEREFGDNKELFNWYMENMDPNAILGENNFYTNGLDMSLIEIYEYDGMPQVRTIPNSRFWVYTDDPINPNVPKAITKFITDKTLTREEKTTYSYAQNYLIYTKDEIMSIDVYKLRGSKELEYKNEKLMENPMGFLPFVFVNYDKFNIIAELDSSSEDMALIGFDLTCDAVNRFFQAFPIRYIKDGPEDLPAGFSINPDDLLRLYSKEGDGANQVEIGELTSSYSPSATLESVKQAVEDFFYTRDCPVQKSASISKSAVAQVIENVDTLENKKAQISYYKKVEKKFWNLLAKYHNYLIKQRTEFLDPDLPKGTFKDGRISVKVEFQLPSAEAEQAKEADEDINNGEKDGVEANG